MHAKTSFRVFQKSPRPRESFQHIQRICGLQDVQCAPFVIVTLGQALFRDALEISIAGFDRSRPKANRLILPPFYFGEFEILDRFCLSQRFERIPHEEMN